MTLGEKTSDAADEAEAHLADAYALNKDDLPEAALRECEAAIEVDPELDEAHNLRGIILEALGRKEEAVVAYKMAVDLNSRFGEAWDNLNELEYELAQKASLAAESSDESLSEIKGKEFAIRAAAYVIDVLVIYGANFVVALIGGVFLGLIMIFSGQDFYLREEGQRTFILCLEGLALSICYFSLFEGLYGASPGKLILGMRVVHADGRPCRLGPAFVRGIFRIIDGFLFGVVAYAHMSKDPLRQRFGDSQAKTVVVGRKASFIKEPREWWWFGIASVAYLALAMIIQLLMIVPAL